MVQVPFWLHRPIKRFVQYSSVMLASVPAGVLWLMLLRVVPAPVAMTVSLSLALLLAYLVWRWLDRKISFAAKPRILVANPATARPLQEPFGLAGTLAVVVVVVVGGQVTFCFPSQYSDAMSTNIVLEKTNAGTDD